MARILFALFASCLPAVAFGNFERLRDHLGGASFVSYVFQNVTFSLGTASGEVFQWSNGDMKDDIPKMLGSGSKWAASTALLAMADAYKVDLDAPMSKYLGWWTTNSSDPRSAATPRHFLTMTSGMVTDGTDSKFDGSDAALRKNYSQVHGMNQFMACFGDNTRCIRELYEHSPALYKPGEAFMYGTLTFNYVAAVMEAVSRKPIFELLGEHFLKPLGMKGSWVPWFKPLLGASLTASNEDMGKFLRAMLSKKFLPEHLHDEQESMAEDFSQYSTQNAGFGPYGMGVWGECIGMGPRPFPDDCRLARRFGHPGCFGYWDFIDRRNGYYFSFMPNYRCDESNRWCGTGKKPSPDEPEACPALNPSGQFRNDVSSLVDDAMRAVAMSSASQGSPRAGEPAAKVVVQDVVV